MDATRFDELARKLAAGATRRGALRAAAGGAIAAALAAMRPAAAEAGAPTCRAYGDVCDRDRECCSQRCSGRCECRRRGANCVFDGRRLDEACCTRRCRANGRCA